MQIADTYQGCIIIIMVRPAYPCIDNFKKETIMHGEILIKLLTAINWISFAAVFIAWWIRKSNADNFRIKGIMSKVMYTALAVFGVSTLALVGTMITA